MPVVTAYLFGSTLIMYCRLGALPKLDSRDDILCHGIDSVGWVSLRSPITAGIEAYRGWHATNHMDYLSAFQRRRGLAHQFARQRDLIPQLATRFLGSYKTPLASVCGGFAQDICLPSRNTPLSVRTFCFSRALHKKADF